MNRKHKTSDFKARYRASVPDFALLVLGHLMISKTSFLRCLRTRLNSIVEDQSEQVLRYLV